jgi:YD repeat-containing protein
MPSGNPVSQTLEITVPAAGAAVAQDQVIGQVDVNGVIQRVSYTPEAAMTGATATARTMQVLNKGQAGAGTAVAATLAFNTGVDLVAFDEKDIPVTATLADKTVVEGDTLLWNETVAGAGTAAPGGKVVVEISRSN